MFGSPAPVCSENRLRWDLSAEQILQLSNELITNTKKAYDRVGALDLDSVSFENTLKVLAFAEVEYTGESSPAELPLNAMFHDMCGVSWSQVERSEDSVMV